MHAIYLYSKILHVVSIFKYSLVLNNIHTVIYRLYIDN